MNDRDKIGGEMVLAVRQSDLHLKEVKDILAAWIKDLARHQTRSGMGKAALRGAPLSAKGANGRCSRHAHQGGHGKDEACREVGVGAGGQRAISATQSGTACEGRRRGTSAGCLELAETSSRWAARPSQSPLPPGAACGRRLDEVECKNQRRRRTPW